MTAVEFKPAARRAIPLLIGLAGGTGSGKTYSALRLAKGLAGGKPFHVIDTENGRAEIYADEFDFLHASLAAPYKPSRYADAIRSAAAAGARVIVVDSTSHSWTGEGGVLEWHDRLEAGDASRKMLAWQEPKADHRVFENALLHVRAHVILCFRASPKVEMKRNENGRVEVVPKQTLTGLDGWIPESDPRLPYELTVSLMLFATDPGIPRPIKLPEKLRSFVPLDQPISEKTGVELGAWAAGSAGDGNANPATADTPADDLELEELANLATRLIADGSISLEQLSKAIADSRGKDVAEMLKKLGGLSFTKLLESLSPEETTAMLQRLSRFAAVETEEVRS